MTSDPLYDVAVVGAGVAGLATCVLLREAGLSVVCVEAHPYRPKLGESLDWSSPGLLRLLGIDTDRLLADGVATYKRKIVVYERGRREWEEAPPPQIRLAPLRFETVTLHVDRTALDARLLDRARTLGTVFIWDRVARVDRDGDHVIACVTARATRLKARWYVDASGTARLLSRTMAIPVTTYGRPKVCVWGYFDTPPLCDGTTFFIDNGDEYLRWVWDIPISPTRTSVGFALPAEQVRERRKGGEPVEAILRQELARHLRFHALLGSKPIHAVQSTSFQPYVTQQVCGANWPMVGEAASMPDPLTGNGVTSGIRHARHAVDAIRAAGPAASHLSPRQRRRYSQHVFRLGHAFNAHVESTIYRPSIRWGLGFRAATYVYTIFAFFMNALHARCDPRGVTGTTLFGLLFGVARLWIKGWTVAARAALWWRPRLARQG